MVAMRLDRDPVMRRVRFTATVTVEKGRPEEMTFTAGRKVYSLPERSAAHHVRRGNAVYVDAGEG